MIMENYSRAVSEMYSQFKKNEANPAEKYIGRRAVCRGIDCEVVGYRGCTGSTRCLIVDGTRVRGWSRKVLDTRDVIFKDCKRYYYVDISNLID